MKRRGGFWKNVERLVTVKLFIYGVRYKLMTVSLENSKIQANPVFVNLNVVDSHRLHLIDRILSRKSWHLLHMIDIFESTKNWKSQLRKSPRTVAYLRSKLSQVLKFFKYIMLLFDWSLKTNSIRKLYKVDSITLFQNFLAAFVLEARLRLLI